MDALASCSVFSVYIEHMGCAKAVFKDGPYTIDHFPTNGKHLDNEIICKVLIPFHKVVFKQLENVGHCWYVHITKRNARHVKNRDALLRWIPDGVAKLNLCIEKYS